MGKIVKGAFGLVGSLLGIGGGKKEAAPAAAPAEKVMPLPDDEAIKRAKKQAISRQMSRGGRSSTILSQSSDTLGGGYG